MSNMLEQAIADAAALREQAIKNAEQSVIEKYSHQIKEAVEQMLEAEEDPTKKVDEVLAEAEEELMQEEEAAAPAMDATQTTEFDTPAAWDSRFDDISSRLTAMVDNLPEDENGMINLDLGDFDVPEEEEQAASGDLGSDLGDLGDLGEEIPDQEAEDDLDNLLGDISDDETETVDDDDLDFTLQEMEEIVGDILSEKTEIDFDPINDELGHHMTNRSRKERNQEMAEIVYEEVSEDEDAEEVEEEKELGRTNELQETIELLVQQNKQLENVLTKMESYLEEALLSNAKLLYQNRTLGDASLNERQKSKIVEAIANAESPKEAKTLHETLKATVGSTPNSNKGPQSLSESVNRRSNLSSMLNSRQNINESKQSADPFLEKMQKLAGIKK